MTVPIDAEAVPPGTPLPAELGLAPKYSRLKHDLLGLIGGLQPGSAIRTERELCIQYGVSRTTVRQAIQELVHEGRLYRIQGKGTFVAQPKLVQTMQLHSHTEEMEALGLRPGARLLSFSTVAPPPEVAAFFELPPEGGVHEIRRLRLVDEAPIAIQTVYLDAARFPDIESSLTGWLSLYRLLRDRYDVRLAGGEETIEAAAADAAQAQLLQLEAGAPLLVLRRCSWEADRKPVEYATSLYRADRYRIVARLTPADGSATPVGHVR